MIGTIHRKPPVRFYQAIPSLAQLLFGLWLLIHSYSFNVPNQKLSLTSGAVSIFISALWLISRVKKRSQNTHLRHRLHFALIFATFINLAFLVNIESSFESKCSSDEVQLVFARIQNIESDRMSSSLRVNEQLTNLFFRVNEVDDFISHLNIIHGAASESDALRDEARRELESLQGKLKRHSSNLAAALHHQHAQIRANKSIDKLESHEAKISEMKTQAAHNLMLYLENNDPGSISESEHLLILDALLDGTQSIDGTEGGPRVDLEGLNELKSKVSRGDVAIERLRQVSASGRHHQALLTEAQRKREQARSHFHQRFEFMHHESKGLQPSSHPNQFAARRQQALRDQRTCPSGHCVFWISFTLFASQAVWLLMLSDKEFYSNADSWRMD